MTTVFRLATVLAVIACLTVTTPARQAQVQSVMKVVHAGRLIDGTSTAVRERASILIADDRIVDVQPGFVSPQGAQVIDLSRATVMSGLIDSHTHITSESGANALLNGLRRVRFVTKGGAVYKEGPSTTAAGSAQ